MDLTQIRLRIANPDDAQSLLRIYGPYVERTAVSFEYEVPSEEEFRQRIRRISRAYPYLVAESRGQILGYAYASAFHERKAFSHAAELSIYLRMDIRRNGLGRTLYTTMESILAMQNITNLYACIAYPDTEDMYLNHDSIRFHTRMGYSPAGRFPASGYKFNRWYNIVWMEKQIGPHTDRQPDFIPFPVIADQAQDRYVIGGGKYGRNS